MSYPLEDLFRRRETQNLRDFKLRNPKNRKLFDYPAILTLTFFDLTLRESERLWTVDDQTIQLF